MVDTTRRAMRGDAPHGWHAKQLARLGGFVLVLLATLAQDVGAAEGRRAMLDACAQQARDRKLSGEEHAGFMRTCLKAPEDAKAPSFSTADPQQTSANGLQPTLTAPTSKPAKAQVGAGARTAK